jgi:outer membrane protein
MSLAQMDHQLKQTKSGYYPSLTLSGSIGTGYSGLASTTSLGNYTGDQQIGYTQDGVIVYQPTYDFVSTPVSFGSQLNDNFNQFVGLTLSVPIFNRNGVNTAVKQTEIGRSIAEIQLEQEKQGLRQRIESAHADSKAARDLLEANVTAVNSAEKAFEFAEKRFEAGASNVVDFNNSKSNLEIAKTQVIRSKYDYLFKVKILDFYMGRPLGIGSE